MAAKKKEQETAAVEQNYSTKGLDSREDVEKAMAGTSYRPSQDVTDAKAALKEWQDQRPGDYQSSYQNKINSLLDQLLSRENFQYSYTQDPLYRQYEQVYTQNAHNASADAAAQAAALTGGYGSSYATSAAQQAYQQQIGMLSNAIPTLYSLALDTYNSGGSDLVTRLDQLSAQEQNDQNLYNQQLSDYYTQLEQKGSAYNNAYAQDYGQYQDYLSKLDTLYNNYSKQEQTEAAQRQQRFNNGLAVLGIIGDVFQLLISGTTGLGSTLAGLMNAGYNIYSGDRAYEASRADTKWDQQMQEKQRQDKLDQQRYDNESSERAYQDALRQQAFNNDLATQKLNLAKSEWALKQEAARQKASRAAGGASSGASGSSTGLSGSSGVQTGTSGTVTVPFTAVSMRSRGKSDAAIMAQLQREGYSSSEIAQIMRQMK